MALSGPKVQSVGNRIAEGLSNGTHRCSFGNVLADQAVEVLIASAFPRVVRGSEVALYWEVLLKCFIAVELSAVVEGDCLEVGSMFLYGIHGSLCNGSGGSRIQLFDDSVAGFSFNESENAVMTIAADHGVCFPMTELHAGFHFRRPFGDMSLARQNSA